MLYCLTKVIIIKPVFVDLGDGRRRFFSDESFGVGAVKAYLNGSETALRT